MLKDWCPHKIPPGGPIITQSDAAQNGFCIMYLSNSMHAWDLHNRYNLKIFNKNGTSDQLSWGGDIIRAVSRKNFMRIDSGLYH